MSENEDKRQQALDRVKNIFNPYVETGDINLTTDEYELLCNATSYLPEDILDIVENELYFVVQSLKKDNKLHPACYLSTEDNQLKNKKGIVFINPHFFHFENSDQGSPTEPEIRQVYAVFHEVAHNILGHKDIQNEEQREKIESEAKDLATDWMAKATCMTLKGI